MNSSVILPTDFKRIGTSRRADATIPEMLHLETFRVTHARKRLLESLKVCSSPADAVNAYNFYHVTSVPSEKREKDAEARGKRIEYARELLTLDIELKRREGERRLIYSFESHYRFAVQVVFNPPRHHWDEEHIRELFVPLIQFDRDISRISFENRGGRFIIVYSPVLLQALKAVQCLVSNIKNGESYLFHDAAVVVDYFPKATKGEANLDEEPVLLERVIEKRGAEPRILHLNRVRERKRRLALKLLRDRLIFPRGRNEIDQRVTIVKQSRGEHIETLKHTDNVEAKQSKGVRGTDTCPVSLLTRASPMTKLMPLQISEGEKQIADPIVEVDTHVRNAHSIHGRFIFQTDGDTITDFVSGANDTGITSMRIDLHTVLNNVQHDESPRDYDLLDEHRYHLRGRKGKAVYSLQNPPSAEISPLYWASAETGMIHRKCSLSHPFLFYSDGDSRLSDLKCESGKLPPVDSSNTTLVKGFRSKFLRTIGQSAAEGAQTSQNVIQ